MGNTYNRVYIWCCKYGENRYCERCANEKLCASKHTGLFNSCLGKLCLHPYLVVPLISARVILISTRVSAHCQAILLNIRWDSWSYLHKASMKLLFWIMFFLVTYLKIRKLMWETTLNMFKEWHWHNAFSQLKSILRNLLARIIHLKVYTGFKKNNLNAFVRNHFS